VIASRQSAGLRAAGLPACCQLSPGWVCSQTARPAPQPAGLLAGGCPA
jgi:hypothetical protein